MKKSIILFIAATGIAVSLYLFPSLYGNVIMKDNNQPADGLSKLWIGKRDLRPVKPLDSEITIVKIIGNSHDLFLNVGQADSSTLNSREVNRYRYYIHQDTLFIEMKGNGNLFVETKDKIKEFIIQNTNLRVVCQGEYPALKIALDQQTRANITSSEAFKGAFVTIDSLDIKAADESVINLAAIKAHQIKAQIDNAEMNYDSSLHVDTMVVALNGRSTVKSSNHTEEQKVKNLTISGNQQYFKKEFAGKGVQIITKP
ncbi:hypothetical protein [Sphingobacterium wenxiniae]|uniref:Uncharacterized protein n=1 Tax=Sphingobacterium wenxiniae TaxID=683125 RepID=A0A1I6TW46_9SPHI|nr:hypothetical protein [Sphingobacterium wenxiniae]SFS93375.1 hypothetical protein SAMN05660206_10783 [Sphingobacterium wenxiniae]